MTRNRPPVLSADDIKARECSLSESASPSLQQLLQARISRRDTLRGGLGFAATTIFAGAGLTACGGDDDGGGGNTDAARLSFRSVAGSSADQVIVPEGYEAQVIVPWGTPILPGAPAFDPASNTAADQAQQTGQSHDGLRLFPLDDSQNSDRVLLALNHEIARAVLFPEPGRTEDGDGHPTVPDEVRKQINAQGVSLVELERNADGRWNLVMDGRNRRITTATPIRMSGPAAGSDFLITPFSPSGTMTRGTANNCGRGFTPWGTYLACEENFQAYFTTGEPLDQRPREKARYGINDVGFGFFWGALAGQGENGEFARFDVTPSGSGSTDDYRNEANNFGWIVEIDPMDPSATPVKRTAMGRMRHEGAEPGLVEAGKPIAFYQGDDQNGEYFYKFVTAENFDPDNPNRDMLDNGTLYVAQFAADGTGTWLPLAFGEGPLVAPDFTNQADVLINTRSAADAVGATPMDRPEWSTTDPNTGEIYLTLTNHDERGLEGFEETDAVNPRPTNVYGHVIRLAESGNASAATSFTWDIFVFGASSLSDPEVNRSGLTVENEFGGPDGLWFDPRGVLWVQTDHGLGNAPLRSSTNNQMLAVIPAGLADSTEGVSASVITPDNQASLKRFLVGPVGCEVTGIDLTADSRNLFVNIQHPEGAWPRDDSTDVPRSATVVIRRTDGGEIAL